MAASPSSRAPAVVLPSIPPSPSLLDEVFSQPRPWSVRLEASDLHVSGQYSLESASGRAKGRVKQSSDIENQGEDEHAQHNDSVREAYPPMTDQAAETRRVEETLKRWELAERQRRKSVRESAQQTSGPSLFESVTRTASLVLSRRSRSSSIGVSSARAPNGTRPFKLQDTVDIAREGYGVPLDDMDHTRASSVGGVAVHSPNTSPSFDRSAGASLDVTAPGSQRTPENPFVHPSERGAGTGTSSLSPPQTPPMFIPVTAMRPLRPSTPPSPTPFSDGRGRRGEADLTTCVSTDNTHVRMRSMGGRSSTCSVPPPSLPKPHPIGLSPPPDDTPRAKQPQPISQPVLRPQRRPDRVEQQEARWWHDWLCGCSEGPDRGGDNQAGRTNPFE